MRTRLPTVLLATGHGSVDLYQGMVPVLVPFLVAERGYDYVAVTGFVLAATLLSSVVQPVFGLLTDRWSMPWLLPVSMLGTGTGTALIGLVESYPLSLLVIALTGVGVAAYHPQAARTARAVTGGGNVGMSWFSLGGIIGFALAPVIAAPLLAVGGLGLTPLLAIPALLGALTTIPLLGRGAARATAVRRTGRDDWASFTRLTTIVVLRSVVYVGLTTFVGLYIGRRLDLSAAASSAVLVVLFGGGVIGTMLGGRLANRWTRLPVIRVAYAGAAVGLAGIAFVPGPVLLVFVVLTAIALSVPFSLHITLGQDYLPNRVGTASGVTLGLAVSAGGVVAPALGALAEATSLQVVFAALVLLPATACLLAHRLAEPA
ncbi:major facilitator superfamily MFS_1 [Kribbella flavida DSM 17836]|uniref:Major facilitator superfamily MFS_1 n=1 Tax=Kribbella flavida (strain DSM 17836 / JCM 10339 / NBRC 14399) TaxID=479435 RepID=D2PXM6_KRIFD|nr:MFS transporter [Kribbella flavida]ADB31668.1 major facilitator superfamily MFS_1 [Kribbella flavida DSM 17836]